MVVVVIAVPKMIRGVGGFLYVALGLFLSRRRTGHGQFASVDGVCVGVILGRQVGIVSCWLQTQEFVQAGNITLFRQVCRARLLADDWRLCARKGRINGEGLVIVRVIGVGVIR